MSNCQCCFTEQLFSDNPNRDPSSDYNSPSVISSDQQRDQPRDRERERDPEEQQYNNQQFPSDQVGVSYFTILNHLFK